MEATLEWEEPKHNNRSPKMIIFCTAAENVASHAVVFRGDRIALAPISPKNDCVGGY